MKKFMIEQFLKKKLHFHQNRVEEEGEIVGGDQGCSERFLDNEPKGVALYVGEAKYVIKPECFKNRKFLSIVKLIQEELEEVEGPLTCSSSRLIQLMKIDSKKIVRASQNCNASAAAAYIF